MLARGAIGKLDEEDYVKLGSECGQQFQDSQPPAAWIFDRVTRTRIVSKSIIAVGVIVQKCSEIGHEGKGRDKIPLTQSCVCGSRDEPWNLTWASLSLELDTLARCIGMMILAYQD